MHHVPRRRSLLALSVFLLATCPALAQDRWARHYQERLEVFRSENAVLPPERQHMVFVGDSITELFPLERFFPELPVLNRGIGVDRVGLQRETGVLHRLAESVFDTNPAVVFLLIGVNDLTASPKPADTWLEGIEAILRQIKKRCPKAQIVLQTLLPVGPQYERQLEVQPKILALNKGLRRLARKLRKVQLLDLHELYRDDAGQLPEELSNDGLHIHPDAYQRWAEAILALSLRLPDPLPTPRLKKGDRGDEVRELQQALEALGFSPGTIDGVYGRGTEGAVRAFQSQHGLPADGRVGDDTLEALRQALREGEQPQPAVAPSQLREGGEALGLQLEGGGPIRVVQHEDEVFAIQYQAKMAICSDGASNITRDKAEAEADPRLRHDPWYLPKTAMNFEGEPVDADAVPYVVLPPPVYQATGAKKGDLCEVTYNGLQCYAIYAEVGPKTKIGEGSMYLARQLGINDDPRVGGLSAHEVTYTILVGSGRACGIVSGGPAVTAAEIQQLGAEAFADARRRGILD